MSKNSIEITVPGLKETREIYAEEMFIDELANMLRVEAWKVIQWVLEGQIAMLRAQNQNILAVVLLPHQAGYQATKLVKNLRVVVQWKSPRR